MQSSVEQRPGGQGSSGNDSIAAVARSFNQPKLVDWSKDQARSGEIYGFDSIDPRSRSFNLIRGRLLELKRRRNIRLIGVVSATPSVGKSFVSANISASLSRDPQLKTFAVDLDLRRGSLTSQFGIDPEHDLGDYLALGMPLECCRLHGEGLTVVPSRGRLVHSAELLATARAQALFNAMRNSDPQSIFICDLPPVFANDDAVATMAHLDSYVLVSEEGQTSERELRDSVDALGRAKLAGVILNKFRGGLVSDGYGVESYYAAGYGEPAA